MNSHWKATALGWVTAGAEPRPGDWVVVHSKSAVGRLVYQLEKLSGGHGDYEHAAYHCCEINGVKMICEMMPGGCQHVPLHYPGGAMAWSSGIIAKGSSARTLSCSAAHDAAEREHLDYSFLDYAAIAARTWHIPAPGLQHFIATSKHMICSQAVAWWEQCGGTQLWPGRWTGYVRPIDLSMLLGAPAPIEVA